MNTENPILRAIWNYITLPLWFLQPSYPDPDAWVVLAFYEGLWITLHILLAVWVAYEVAKRFPPEE